MKLKLLSIFAAHIFFIYTLFAGIRQSILRAAPEPSLAIMQTAPQISEDSTIRIKNFKDFEIFYNRCALEGERNRAALFFLAEKQEDYYCRIKKVEILFDAQLQLLQEQLASLQLQQSEEQTPEITSALENNQKEREALILLKTENITFLSKKIEKNHIKINVLQNLLTHYHNSFRGLAFLYRQTVDTK